MDLSGIPLELIIAILIGLLTCFAGYKIKRIAFAIIWFIIGYWLVKTYLPNVIDNQFWQWILQVAAGALLSLIGLSIEKLAVSFTAGIVVTFFILQHFGPATDWTLPAIAIAIGVVTGVVAVSLMKPAIIIYTAFFGANLLSTAIVGFIPAEARFAGLEYILLGAFMVGGAVYQFKSCKNLE
jgi:hypothetical protein